MNNEGSANKFVAIKTLIAKILRQFYVTDSVPEKEDLQEKYTTLLMKAKELKNVELNNQQKQLVEKIDRYSALFEEYHLTKNIIRKAEIEEIFESAMLDDEIAHYEGSRPE